jgi:hypothetical protein
MSAPASVTPTFDPAVPMTAKWCSDLAWRLANGWTWKELAETLSCDADELRFATENDSEFAQVQERAWARVTFDGEADGMRRLRQVANTGSGDSAQHAAEVLAEYAAERRRNDTRIALEKERTACRIAVEKLRTERAALKARKQAKEDEEWVGPPREVKETEAEWQKRSDREHAERAAAPEAKVYLWGGKHALGRSIPPDESDIRVRLEDDWSVPSYGPSWNLIYWIVPYTPTDTRTPNPLAAQAAAALQETFADHPPKLIA